MVTFGWEIADCFLLPRWWNASEVTRSEAYVLLLQTQLNRRSLGNVQLLTELLAILNWSCKTRQLSRSVLKSTLQWIIDGCCWLFAFRKTQSKGWSGEGHCFRSSQLLKQNTASNTCSDCGSSQCLTEYTTGTGLLLFLLWLGEKSEQVCSGLAEMWTDCSGLMKFLSRLFCLEFTETLFYQDFIQHSAWQKACWI